MSLLESRKLFASNFLLSWRAATSSASPLWYLMHSFPIPPVVVNTSGVNEPWVQPFLVIFMDAIDLLWLLVLVQSCIFCSIGPSHELFFSDALENWVDLDVVTYHTQKIGVEVSQLTMTSDNKTPSFANHCVVYCEVFFIRTYWWNVIERPIIT